MKAGEPDWTKENVQKLYVQMKRSIPGTDVTCSYVKGMQNVDWNEVAFPPFSAEDCQRKWRQVLQKMRKRRSLMELIVEAEDVLSNPVLNRKTIEDAEGLPPRPPMNGYKIFCKDQLASMDGVSNRDYMKVWSQRWQELTEREKKKYSENCNELKRKYTIKLQNYIETLDEEEQKNILRENAMYIIKEKSGSVKGCIRTETEDPSPHRQSDSEDEDIEDSSSDEEEDYPDFDEDEEEEEEEEGDITFDMY